MALFDGFFDSYYDEETGTHDREYGADEFTEYFDQMIGSGVCIYKNPDSFKVVLKNGAAVVSPGYLFIQGYWLKNDAEYTVELDGSGPFAIVAHLDLGKRMIDIMPMPVAENYPDCLVLSIANPANNTAEDTRYNSDICGVIDAPGSLSEKIEYAINYIDNEAEARLKQIESDMAVQEKKIDKKIADVEAEAIKMEPLPVGTIKFSANPNVGEKWLKCDGSFISEADYPELVQALRGLKGGLYDQELLSTFFSGGDINPGTFFKGYFWAFCKDEKKIYRVSLEDGTVKEINAVFPQSAYIYTQNTLSIVEIGSQITVYLLDNRSCSQAVYDGTGSNVTGSKLSLTYFYSANFSISQNTVSFSEKTITGTPPESFQANSYAAAMPERNFDYRPVVAYNSAPYVSLEIRVWSSQYPPNTNAGTGTVRLDRSLVLANLSGSGEFFLHRIDYKTLSGGITQAAINQLYNGTDSSLTDATPMDPGKGGLMIANDSGPTAYSVKGANKQRLGSGSNAWSILGSGKGFSSFCCPIITDDYLVFSIGPTNSYVVRRYNMDFVKTELSGNWGEYLHNSRIAKDKLYMPDCGIYAQLTSNGIVLTRKPDDPAQYTFVSTVEKFGPIPASSGSLRTTMVEYHQENHVLYVIWQNPGYRINIGAIKVPEGFDPFNGASLPELESSGIPAYIKAKEG